MDLLLSFLGFAFASSITPGPNNAMVAASAAAHGVRAVLPQVLGIGVGFGLMIVLVGLGLSGPLATHPGLHRLLRWVGAGWLLLIAWRIARADAPNRGASRPPLGFAGAAAFQWVNPKAWVLALATATTYTRPDAAVAAQVARLAALFVVVSIPCTLAWSFVGAGAGRLLGSGRRLRAFNAVMAALLAASVIPVLLEG